MKSTATEQREWLREFAKAVAFRLRARQLAAIAIAPEFPVRVAPYPDGWWIEIGDLRLPSGDVAAAFLDNNATGDDRCVWVGIFARGIPRMRAIAAHAAKYVGPCRVLTSGDFITRNHYLYMRSKLRPRDFNIPVLELFDASLKSFGMYFSEDLAFARGPSRTLVDAATRFLEQTLSSLDTFQPRSSKRQNDKPFSNKNVIVTTITIARSSRQAADAKARDRFRCRLCKQRPEDRYGAEGRACLEAHHVRALHALRHAFRVTRLRDLVTVCANCHRALARVAPNERGFRQLQRRFSTWRKSSTTA